MWFINTVLCKCMLVHAICSVSSCYELIITSIFIPENIWSRGKIYWDKKRYFCPGCSDVAENFSRLWIQYLYMHVSVLLQKAKAMTSNAFTHECHSHNDHGVLSLNMKTIFHDYIVPGYFGCSWPAILEVVGQLKKNWCTEYCLWGTARHS